MPSADRMQQIPDHAGGLQQVGARKVMLRKSEGKSKGRCWCKSACTGTSAVVPLCNKYGTWQGRPQNNVDAIQHAQIHQQ